MDQIRNKLNTTPLHIKVFSFISSLLLVWGFYHFEKPAYSTVQTILILVLLFLCSILFFCAAYACKLSIRTHICCSLFALLFSVIYIGFYELYASNAGSSFLSSCSLLLKHLPYVLGLTIFLSSLLSVLIYSTSVIDHTLLSTKACALFRHPVLIAFIIFLCWIPCYLSYYPGIFSYDMFTQTPQALGLEPISKFHPPLHTLLWKLFLDAENTLGINALIAYSITQMLIMSCCLSYLLHYFAGRRIHPIFLYISLGFFCLNPVVAIYSFIPTKDVLFAAAIIFLSIELLILIGQKKSSWTNCLRLIFASTLCCLLRNNMIYALIVASFFSFIFIRQKRKVFAFCFLSIILFYTLVNGPIYKSMGIQDGNPREMLSVPIQQIAHITYAKTEELTDEDFYEIEKYIPGHTIAYYYRTRTVDLVKFNFYTENFVNDPKAFIRLWANLVSRYTDDALTAFFNLNIPYWYPGAASVDSNATIDPSSPGYYIETGIYTYEQTGYEISRSSILPRLNTFYERFATTAKLDNPLISSDIFSITTPIWLILLAFLFVICQKKNNLLIVIFPMLFLWCTYLLGPVSNCRYVFPIMLSYPILMMLIFQPSKLTDDSSIHL